MWVLFTWSNDHVGMKTSASSIVCQSCWRPKPCTIDFEFYSRPLSITAPVQHVNISKWPVDQRRLLSPSISSFLMITALLSHLATAFTTTCVTHCPQLSLQDRFLSRRRANQAACWLSCSFLATFRTHSIVSFSAVKFGQWSALMLVTSTFRPLAFSIIAIISL